MTMAKKISKVEAQALEDQIVEGLVMADEALASFIPGRGWEALGYVEGEAGFGTWWQAHMTKTKLGREMTHTVIYTLFDAGMSNKQIARDVKGVGPEGAAELRRQKGNGTPPADATTVRQHERRRPSERRRTYVEFSELWELKAYEKAAKSAGLDFAEENLRVIRARWRPLL